MALAYKYQRLPSSNHSARSGFKDYTGKITHICIHHWGIDGQRHSNVVRWLRGKAGGTSNTGSSAHYVCSDNLVTNLVAEDRASWAAKGANGYAIHIEMRPEMSNGDWATLVQLCCNIEERRGSMQYTNHGNVAPTQCPGRYAKRMGDLVRDINAEHKRRGNDPKDPRRKAKGGAVAAKPSNKVAKPAPGSSGSSAKSVATMAKEVIQGKHGNGHAARRKSLGVDAATYKKVRAEVNKRLS